MDNEPLVLDMLEWIGAEVRPYDVVLAAWRTSCPRLTIWEDSVDAGLISVDFDRETRRIVCLTPAGRQLLRQAGRDVAEPSRC